MSAQSLLTSSGYTERSPHFQLIAAAAGSGIGGALLQGENFIAFEGRKYGRTEGSCTVREQELPAVVHVLYVWHCDLIGSPKFEVVPDHNPLVYIILKPLYHNG